MDTLSLREKAALCLRIASRLSWNNPSRLQLTDLADRLDRQAKEIELQNHRTQEAGMTAAGPARSQGRASAPLVALHGIADRRAC